MKKILLIVGILLFVFSVNAQVGINTTSPNSTLDVNGSFGSKVTVVNADLNLQIQHSVVICNSTTAIEISLPEASSCAGRIYVIKNITTNMVTLKTQNGQTIDGSTSFLIQNINAVIQTISNGNNWYVLDKYNP